MILIGKRIVLRPIRTEEFFLFYKWATQSKATPFWYGEPCGTRIPSLQDFMQEWQPFYFDGSQPEKGRSFVIIADGQRIGQINYNEINRVNNSVNIDILIAEDIQQGKGYGSDALQTLATYLYEHMQVSICDLIVLSTNERAIHTYQKLGFSTTQQFTVNGIGWQKMEMQKQKVSVVSI